MAAALQLLPQMQQRLGPHAEGLTDIFAVDVNLTVWQRGLSAEVAGYAAQLLQQPHFQLQGVKTLDELQPWLQLHLPDVAGRAEFIADLEQVSQMLACLMDCHAVGFRLKVLPHAMCPRFHTDHVALRLLVTYVGEGTEWLVGQPGAGCEPDAFAKLQPGDVALLKGSAWPEQGSAAIWHRSPASMGPRLLLSLDPVGE